VSSSHQFANIMTKGLSIQLFTDFLSRLSVCDSPDAIVVVVRDCIGLYIGKIFCNCIVLQVILALYI
jgi:hypothetical protein